LAIAPIFSAVTSAFDGATSAGASRKRFLAQTSAPMAKTTTRIFFS